jgi:hypothetical protein
MALSEEELKQIRARANAATCSNGNGVYTTVRGGVVLLNGPFPLRSAQAVAEFHKYTYQDIPALLDEVERLRAALNVIAGMRIYELNQLTNNARDIAEAALDAAGGTE